MLRLGVSADVRSDLETFNSAISGQFFDLLGEIVIGDRTKRSYYYSATSTSTVDNDNVIGASGMGGVGRYLKVASFTNLTTTGTGVATFDSVTGVLNIPTPGVISKSFIQVTRAVNSTAFIPSTTKDASVFYSINIACTATIGSTSSGKVALQYSVNGGSTWVDVSEVSNSNTVSLAVVLNSVSSQTCVLAGQVPAGASVRMVSTSAGTTTITYVRGQEVY